MTNNSTRRTFLKTSGSVAAAALVSGFSSLSGPSRLRAERLGPHAPEIESLMRLIEATPRDEVAPVVAEQLRKGVTYHQFLEAMFLTATRISGGHNVWVHHSVAELSAQVSEEYRLLPLFWQIDLIKARRTDKPVAALNTSQLPQPDKAVSVYRDASQRFDQDAAEAAIVSIARSEGPKKAFQILWSDAAGSRGVPSQGHSAIAIANTWRSMERVGWQFAEPLLRNSARVCSSKANHPRDNLHQVNARRATEHAKLPPDWQSLESDRSTVLDIISVLREGKSIPACAFVFDQLRSGTISAQSVWDAVFLITSELSVRYKFGGPSGRPRHSITATNAMHFIFRTLQDPEVRLFTLLQAVFLTCSFLRSSEKSGDLNDFDITQIPEVESPESSREAVAEIFSLLPPRRFQHWFRDRSDQDKVLQLAYAMGRRHSDAAFMAKAQQLLCTKCSIDAHNLKFPIAAFENYRHLSPHWQPNLLASTVFILQGTQMEDSPYVAAAREQLEL